MVISSPDLDPGFYCRCTQGNGGAGTAPLLGLATLCLLFAMGRR